MSQREKVLFLISLADKRTHNIHERRQRAWKIFRLKKPESLIYVSDNLFINSILNVTTMKIKTILKTGYHVLVVAVSLAEAYELGNALICKYKNRKTNVGGAAQWQRPRRFGQPFGRHGYASERSQKVTRGNREHHEIPQAPLVFQPFKSV